MKFHLFILSYDGKTKLYFNRMLNAWVPSKGNASPYSEEFGDNGIDYARPYGIRTELAEEAQNKRLPV